MFYKVATGSAEECMFGNIILRIRGMTSSKCEMVVKNAVLRCNGVKDARVSYKKAHATVEADFFKVDVNELRDVVEGAGFSVSTMYFSAEI